MFVCTAYGATASSSPLRPLQINRRDPGASDVEIEILYCGVCHSDLHFARNEWQFTEYPAVPGHEIVGRAISGANKHENSFFRNIYKRINCPPR